VPVPVTAARACGRRKIILGGADEALLEPLGFWTKAVRLRQLALTTVRPEGNAGPGSGQSGLRTKRRSGSSRCTGRERWVKELAREFGVHRVSVTALLQRHGVALRPVGLSPEQVTEASRRYGESWSVARLGETFGVDGTTVWRALKLVGVVMRAASEPRRVRPDRAGH
jgi:hypothetical protein